MLELTHAGYQPVPLQRDAALRTADEPIAGTGGDHRRKGAGGPVQHHQILFA